MPERGRQKRKVRKMNGIDAVVAACGMVCSLRINAQLNRPLSEPLPQFPSVWSYFSTLASRQATGCIRGAAVSASRLPLLGRVDSPATDGS